MTKNLCHSELLCPSKQFSGGPACSRAKRNCMFAGGTFYMQFPEFYCFHKNGAKQVFLLYNDDYQIIIKCAKL